MSGWTSPIQKCWCPLPCLCQAQDSSVDCCQKCWCVAVGGKGLGTATPAQPSPLPPAARKQTPHTEDHTNLASVILHRMAKFGVACGTEKPSAGCKPFPGLVLLFGDSPLLKPGSLQERPRKALLAILKKLLSSLGVLCATREQ